VSISGTARRLRGVADSSLDSSSEFVPSGTVVCAKCGQRFAIRSDRPLPSAELAEKQAAWVADQLLWDHIQERKHHGTMQIPELLEQPASAQ